MYMLSYNVAALAVALIFYTWRAYQEIQGRQSRTLRQRVAYMLWVLANRTEGSKPDFWLDGPEALSRPEAALR